MSRSAVFCCRTAVPLACIICTCCLTCSALPPASAPARCPASLMLALSSCCSFLSPYTLCIPLFFLCFMYLICCIVLLPMPVIHPLRYLKIFLKIILAADNPHCFFSGFLLPCDGCDMTYILTVSTDDSACCRSCFSSCSLCPCPLLFSLVHSFCTALRICPLFFRHRFSRFIFRPYTPPT